MTVGQIRYELSAVSWPCRNHVDHSEKGGLVPMMDSPAAAAAILDLEPAESAATAESLKATKARARRHGGPQLPQIT